MGERCSVWSVFWKGVDRPIWHFHFHFHFHCISSSEPFASDPCNESHFNDSIISPLQSLESIFLLGKQVFRILFLIPLDHAHLSSSLSLLLPDTNEPIYITTSRFIYFKKRFVLLGLCYCCYCCCFKILQCDFSLILTILFFNLFICFVHHTGVMQPIQRTVLDF